MAGEALHVHLCGRLGERKVVRPKAHDGVFAVHAANHGLQRAFEVGERDAPVDDQPLNLVENRRVGGVHLVGAVDPPGGDDADGRLLLLHHAHLHRRGLRAQQDVVGDIERVLRVARRVVLRHVQGLEVVVVVLHLRPLDNAEPHADENPLDFPQFGAQRVAVAELPARAGQGHVDFLPLQPARGLRLLKLLRARRKFGFDVRADFVGQLAHGRSLLGGKAAHPLQNGGQLPLFAEVADPQLLQAPAVLRPAQFALRRLADCLQLLFHALSSFRSGEYQKSPRPQKGRRQRLRGTTLKLCSCCR